MKDIRIYFCDFWSGFDINNNHLINILRKYYKVILDPESPELLFYSCFGFNHIKFKNVTKVFFTSEAIEPNFNECDYAIGYSPVEFGERYFQMKPYVEYDKNEIERGLLSRKFCNFIYSQDSVGEGAWLRKKFCQILMEYKHIDAPGKILNNMKNAIEPRYGDWYNGKLDFIKNYKFTIAIENTEMYGYVTEKLLQPLQVHSVPIYWGAPDVGKYLNTKSFINLRDFKNLKEAIDYIRYVDNNDEEYMKILMEDPNLSIDSGKTSIENFLCSIVEKGNKSYPKSPLIRHEPQVACLYNHTLKLAEFYLDIGDVSSAKECIKVCMSLDTYLRANAYELLEDIYSEDKDELLAILDRQKQNIIQSSMIRNEYLKELCKIATCYAHIGENALAGKLVEYVLQADPYFAEAKSILSIKPGMAGKRNLDFYYLKGFKASGEKINSINNIFVPKRDVSYNYFRYNILTKSSKITIRISGIKCSVDQFTLGFYDFKHGRRLRYEDHSASKNVEISFVTGDDVEGLALCVYAGIAGQTQGQEISINSLDVWKVEL